MGFGKFLAGGLCAVGAVIAAPVVLPMAAAAGAAAMAGAAGAVATVGGAAAAVGTAVAGSTAGVAVGGAMATVGGAVGGAAGAVGLSSVATVAGTTAGATAVGTIATSAAIGATSAVSGASKMGKASEISKEAKDRSDAARIAFDKVEKSTNDSLESLGTLKIQIWDGFERYKVAYDKIQNIEEWEKLEVDEELQLDKNELNDIHLLAMSARDIVKDGVISLTGGQLAGLATSAGITSVATASTGTAIASLNGAAAANASLAALGGGSLASGGLGMAGGAIVSGALAAAPVLAIGGLFLNSRGKKSLENAEVAYSEAEEYIRNLHTASKELSKLHDLSEKIKLQLEKYRPIYETWADWLENLVASETDFRKFTQDEVKKLYISGQIVSILKHLTLTKLINEEDGTEGRIAETTVNDTIKQSNHRWKAAEAKLQA